MSGASLIATYARLRHLDANPSDLEHGLAEPRSVDARNGFIATTAAAMNDRPSPGTVQHQEPVPRMPVSTCTTARPRGRRHCAIRRCRRHDRVDRAAVALIHDHAPTMEWRARFVAPSAFCVFIRTAPQLRRAFAILRKSRPRHCDLPA